MTKYTEAKKFIRHCAEVLSNYTENEELKTLRDDMLAFGKPLEKKQIASGQGLKDLLLRSGIEPTGNREDDIKLAKKIMMD